jgi:hypothetical protein
MSTIWTVTDCSSESQLRDFIENKAASGDTITFDGSGTITLTSPLSITKELILAGLGKPVILDGGNQVGVLSVQGVRLTLKGLTVINGKTELGGGLFNKGGEVTITNCTFSTNSAKHGGGLFNEGGKVTVSFSTFSGNSASAWGGGLYNNFGELTVSFSTLVKNTASVGGGWATIVGPFRVSATIVSHNTARYSSSQNGCGKVTSLGFNLESGTDCDLSTLPTDHQNTDPLLDPTGLQNNGGPTQTIALQSGSPAIGAIPAERCPSHDQRGYLRPGGLSACAIGAYQPSYTHP